MEECHWGRRGQESFYLVMRNSGWQNNSSPGAMALKKLQMSSCTAPTAVLHLSWSHHPISERYIKSCFCCVFEVAAMHGSSEPVPWLWRLCRHVRAGWTGEMAGWCTSVPNIILETEHSLDPETGSEDSSGNLLLPKRPCLQWNHYWGVWKTHNSLMIHFSFSHSSELSEWILSILACNNNQLCGVAQRNRGGGTNQLPGLVVQGEGTEEGMSVQLPTGNSAPGRSLLEAVSNIWIEKQLWFADLHNWDASLKLTVSRGNSASEQIRQPGRMWYWDTWKSGLPTFHVSMC